MIEFQVEGMSCQHCVGAVTKAIKAIDAHADVQIELSSGIVRVDSDDTPERFGAAISDAGYDVKRVARSA
ncbi:cation transporter [Trinickia caryophylli]|uniref:Copper chaperone n=1 Tax=Trinickia caryophylli TaxID=28094 RepID=A0A1X7CPF9_TRICW|nr:cation transporter [Trinickia caryophylli]PMS11293.1 copper chaperone [Trinickia caryophylli]TRX16774.1 heavy-metal-associated domain-containing protein [Trinickia caryophylli]WQE12503.1 cation transporter [Trinickia caryophylli]SMF00273.1 copper chaperone [Trinickia caryophylli]GLU30184.1 heavy metal transport/detoxification protein [Trinickia caryophylli]